MSTHLSMKDIKKILFKNTDNTSPSNNIPKVSVILPSYNRGQKCVNTIKAILNQTYQDIELIVINDGSEDEHTSLIEKYISDDRIKYFTHDNIGQVKSMNIGLDNTTGEYVTWISDDNIIKPTFIEDLVNLRADFVYSDYSVNGKRIVKLDYKNVKNLINHFHGMAAFMWKREIIHKIGYFGESLSFCEDYDFEIRTFMVTDNIKHIDKVLINFCTIGDTQSSRNRIQIKETHVIVQNFYNIYLDNIFQKDHIVICSTNKKDTEIKSYYSNVFNDFDESYAKISICNCNNLYYDQKNRLLVISNKYEELIYNVLKNNTKPKYIIMETDGENSIDNERIKQLKNTTVKYCDNILSINNNNEFLYEISIVMSYYNRKDLIIQTLNRFEINYSSKYNFEVIIVDDNSKEDQKLDDILNNYSFDINLIEINGEEKGNRINPCSAYNKGFSEAKGKIIIIQNPECYHIGDIIGYTLENLKEQDYFSYSCYTANNKEITFELLNTDEPFNLVNNTVFNEKNNTRECVLTWYNHPTERGRNVAYHYCSAIYKCKLDLIGGFDHRFSEGYCFDDDELLLTIKYNLKLNINIIDPESCFVIHQYHTRNASCGIELESDDHPIKKKWVRNKNLYEQMKINHEQYNFKYPKLLSLYWDGSPLSYLNYLTVLSFNKYNKDWKIIIYVPICKTENISWKTPEQKLKYTGKCYFDKLKEIHNVTLQKICLNKIGFDNNVSEVIKSDYFRYYILKKHGGLWSDFDIIYTGSIEERMNFDADSVIFRCKDRHYCYYPIGLLLCIPNTKIFKYILEQCKSNYDKNTYQSIGSLMLRNLFPNVNDVYKIDKSVKVCGEEYYLPWAYNQLNEFLDKKDNVLPENNVGIHWFNGADKAKQYAIDLDKRLNKDYFEITCFLDKYVIQYISLNNNQNNNHYIENISVLLKYENRKDQLVEKLDRYEKLYKNIKNFEVVILQLNQLDNNLIEIHSKYSYDIKIIKFVDCDNIYDLGIANCKNDIILIEHMVYVHDDNLFKLFENEIKDNDIVCLRNPINNTKIDNKFLFTIKKYKYFDCIVFRRDKLNFNLIKDKLNFNLINEAILKTSNLKYKIIDTNYLKYNFCINIPRVINF